MYEYYRLEKQDRFRMLSMQKKTRTTQQQDMKRNQLFVRPKIVK